VVKYVLDLAETQEFLVRTRDLLAYVMPKYEREGKSYLTIAIGCTGGRHRSVVLADVLAKSLEPITQQPIEVVHRDVQRRDHAQAATTPSTEIRDADAPVDERSSVSMIERVGVTQQSSGSARSPSSQRGSR